MPLSCPQTLSDFLESTGYSLNPDAFLHSLTCPQYVSLLSRDSFFAVRICHLCIPVQTYYLTSVKLYFTNAMPSIHTDGAPFQLIILTLLTQASYNISQDPKTSHNW